MKTTENQSQDTLFKKLGFLEISLCILCCALPILGTIVGIGTLASIAVYLEKIGLAVLIASAGSLIFWSYIKSRSSKTCSRTCDIQTGGNCNCKVENKLTIQ